MTTNKSFNDTAYEVTNASSELRLRMEALQSLLRLMESAYFEPLAENFVKCLTVQQWEEIQLNVYTLMGLVDAIMKDCKAVEALTERLYERTIKSP